MLIVDDELGVLEVLEAIISTHGDCPVRAESAEEILKLLPYWIFDVALIDQNLPGMEGLILGEFLRKNNRNMTIAVPAPLDIKTKDEIRTQLGYNIEEALACENDILEGLKKYYGLAADTLHGRCLPLVLARPVVTGRRAVRVLSPVADARRSPALTHDLLRPGRQ